MQSVQSSHRAAIDCQALIVAGPSGTGKTTVTRKLAQLMEHGVLIQSSTTRKPSEQETHGRDYRFVPTMAEFERLVEQDFFLEYAQVYGNYYGTPRDHVEQALQKGKIPIFEVDWQGAMAIKRKLPFAISVYLMPPSVEDLRERLQKRARDQATTIAERLNMAQVDMKQACHFDYVITNHRIADTVAQILALLREHTPALSQDSKAP